MLASMLIHRPQSNPEERTNGRHGSADTYVGYDRRLPRFGQDVGFRNSPPRCPTTEPEVPSRVPSALYCPKRTYAA